MNASLNTELERNELAARPVDPTTVESLITMCAGALDELEKQASLLSEALALVRNPSDQISPTPPGPEANCELGLRVAGVYNRIVHVSRTLQDVRAELRIQ